MLSIKKNNQKVWVTFTYEANDNVSQKISNIVLCGAWNDWQEEPMKQKKSGDFYITKVLKEGSTFEFGYKINNSLWCVEDDCEKVLSPFGTQNSLLKL